MKQTALVFTPKYYKHRTGLHHPEAPRRLKVIMEEIKRVNQRDSHTIKLIRPVLAEIRDLKLVHTTEHVELVERTCKHGGGLLDLGDTAVSPESFEVARFAVGGALRSVNSVLNGEYKNAFSLSRPPGHHAGPYYAAGFCVFNNVAVAATHLVERLDFKRILILDIDAHHGNGTQEIFYNTDKVLYASLHQDPSDFPGTGFADEIGKGKGLGYNVNVPFPFHVGNEAYLEAFDSIIAPIIEQYSPQFVLGSIGYDGYYKDPVARLSLSTAAYIGVFERILDLASRLCNDRFVAILEGGYNLQHLGKLVAVTVSQMAEIPFTVEKEGPSSSSDVNRRAQKVVREVEKALSGFWNLGS